MKRALFSSLMILLFVASAPFADRDFSLHGNIRFKDFKSDRDRFERNIDRAGRSMSEEEWQSIVDTGREALRADWERNADAEAERYIREGLSPEEVEDARRRALDDWERDYARAAALEKGKWFAVRENLVYGGADLSELKERIALGADDESIKSAAEWDAFVREALESVESQWHERYLPEIALLKSKGAHLSDDELAGFEQEAARIENALRRYFDLEMGSMLYLSRNKFITELFYDRDSLRAKSEGESASVITDRVIQGVMNDLRSEEEAILNRSFNSEQIGSPDISGLGENWQEELKRLIETGMKRWARAREDLYREMIDWKGGAEEAYQSAEARWRRAADELENARALWERNLTGEIYAGIEKWRDQERELNENIERAQKDFQTYVDTLRSQWGDHSQGLMAMAVNGSKVYGEAVNNIKWLQDMCEKYNNIGAFGNLGEAKQGNEKFSAIISEEMWDSINALFDSLPVKQSYYDSYKTGRYSYNSSYPDMRLGTTYYKGSYYTYEYAGSVERQDSNGNWYLEEKYTVKLYGRRVTYRAMPIYSFFNWDGGSSSNDRNYQWVEDTQLLKEFTVVNSVNVDSHENEKSPYFYYKTELERWKNIKDTFGKIALDAELTMGDNMTGNPGFLVNVNGKYELNDRENQNDPYLMTRAEYEYELAKRDKEFWEKRLAIAKAVYDYAYPANGKRESADVTEARKISAEAAMNEAREKYNTALKESSDIVEELKRIQSGGEGSIEELAKKFEIARDKLVAAENDFLSAKTKLIILENGENHEYVKKEIEGIQRNIAETEKRIADKRLEYIQSLMNADAASKVYEYSESFIKADRKRIEAEAAFRKFIADNNGEIDDENIEKYFALKLEYETAKAIADAMTDTEFDAHSFLKSDNKLNPEVYSRYAAYSLEALKRIDDGFKEFEPEEGEDNSAVTYENVKGYLETLAEGLKFTHDTDNSDFIINSDYIIIKTALRIFEERYKGLTPEAWGAYRKQLDDDLARALIIHKFYTEEYDSFYLPAVFPLDEGIVWKIREYNNPGSAIAGFEEITRYDREDEFDFKVHEELKRHVAENFDNLYSTEKAGKNENYLAAMTGRIILKTGYYDPSEIELNGIENFNIRNLSPAQMSLAVEAVHEYMNELEKNGISVPLYIEETYNTLLASKERLDQYFYIEDYVSGRLTGSADEIYAEAKKRAETAEEMTELFSFAGEVLELYGIDDDARSMHIISMYASLSEDLRSFIEGNENEDIKSAVETIKGISSAAEKMDIYNLAGMYLQIGGTGTPEDFASSQGLDEEKRLIFLEYMNELSDAGEERWGKVMEDFSRNREENGKLLDMLYNSLPGALQGAGDEYREAFKDLHRAEGLRGFVSGGGKWDSWRDSVLNIDGDDLSFSSVPVTSETSWYDRRDEDGFKDEIRYSQDTIEKDGRVFSMSLIIEEANRLEEVFAALFEASKFSPDKKIKSVEDVINVINELKKQNADYTEKELSNVIVVLGLDSVNDLFQETAEIIHSELYSMEMMLGQSESSLIEKRNIYDYLSGGSTDREERQKMFETAREAHEEAKREYEDIQTLLKEAQSLYNTRNSEYITKMNEASSLYGEFKNLEFEYEKAYSVWEYGNTPYLKGEGSQDSGFNHGTMPGTDGNTTTEFAHLNVPDARDNYKRIEKKYNEVLTEFNEKKTAKDKQQTIADLQKDQEYQKLKDDFIRKSEEYIRASQVNVQIVEDMAEYRLEYERSQDAYEYSKERVKFYNDRITVNVPDGGNSISSANGAIIVSEELSDAEKEELKKQRDIFLYHVSKYGLNKYMKALRNYSSYRIIGDPGNSFIFGGVTYFSDKYLGNIDSANAFNNLPQELKDSVVMMYDYFRSHGSALDNIYLHYQNFKRWEKTAEDSRRRWKGTSKARFITRSNRKADYEKHRDKRDNYKSKYYHEGYEPLKKTLEEFLQKRSDYVEKSEIYKGVSQVLTLEEVKAYLKKLKYNLTDEDLSYLYDESNMEGFKITSESINIGVIRNEERRKDIDEEDVFAKIIDGKIAVLDKDGNPIEGEIYKLDNPGVKLKRGGENIEEYEEGETYELYDRSYDISKIAGLIKDRAKSERDKHYAALMEYVKSSAAEGKNDYTVMLRDLERSFNGLVETAVNFNRTDDKGEIRQRSFEGYSTVADEYINNIQTAVLEEMIKQNRSFQEQLWQQQREKFTERKDRWMEVTGYIFNRGNRDWSIKMSEFEHQWLKWRFETRKEIEKGEAWWLEQDLNMREEMGRWSEEASNAGSKTAVEKMYADLEGRVSGYEKKIKGNISAGGNFNIDTDAILKNALSSIPEMSIGVLNNSMSAVDTTAGLSNMLNLGLNGSLFIHNEKEMAAYEQAYSVMQNMRVLDILNAILDGFNEQLNGANESLYEAVETGIARQMPYAVAGFDRDEKSREWKLKVCVESNLTGNKFKTRRFADYKDYKNSTVFLEPVKGLGYEIDFTKPSSYINIDKDELDVYVGLAGEFLNRKIEDVFKEGGYFSGHQEEEFDRLGRSFGKYYQQWEAGEALRSAGFYSKPMFPNGPNMLQAASIAASFSGQAWVAVLVSTLTTGIQVADGSMDWKQGAFQIGMSAATAALGAGAGEMGKLAGEAGTFANAAAKSATMQIGNTLLSGVSLEGGKLGYDTKKITSSKTWTSAGISMAASLVGDQYCASDMSKAVVSGAGSGLSQGVTTGDWKDSMKTGLATSVGNYLGGVLGGSITKNTGMDSFAINNFVNYSMRSMLGSGEKFSWDTVAQNDSVNQMISKYVTESFMSEDLKQKQAEDEQKRRDEQKRAMDNFEFANFFENTIGGFFSQLGKDMDKLASDVGNAADGLKSAWGSIKSGEAWESIKTGAASAWEGIKGAASWVKDTAVSAWNGVKDTAVNAWNSVAGAVSSAVGAVGTFAEKTGNWFVGDGFNTDDQVEEIRAKERIQEAIKNGTALEEGSAEYKRMEAALNKKFNVGADPDSQLRADEKLASYKNNKDVDSSLKNLTDLAQQNGGGSEYVREELKKALSKIPGGDKLNIDKIIESSCVSLSVWVALKQAGADVGEYGEFYADQVKKGNISAENASVDKIIDLANSYKIDGKKPEVGFTRDFNKYEKLLNSGEVTNGVVLFEKTTDKYHAINVYSSNEGIKFSDVSYRTHGSLASEYTNAKKGNFRWLFYVKEGRR